MNGVLGLSPGGNLAYNLMANLMTRDEIGPIVGLFISDTYTSQIVFGGYDSSLISPGE